MGWYSNDEWLGLWTWRVSTSNSNDNDFFLFDDYVSFIHSTNQPCIHIQLQSNHQIWFLFVVFNDIPLISSTRESLEKDVVQDCMNLCVHASSPRVFLATKHLLGSFVHYRKNKELWNRLTELYEPVLFRSLSAVNARVRRQAVIVFTDCFPLGTSESRDNYSIEEQFKAMLVG